MALIKSTSSHAADARPFNLADIEGYARRMLLKARQDADQLLAAAQAQADRMKEESRITGLAEGKKEGIAQGKAEGLKIGKTEAFTAEQKQLSELMQTMRQSLESLDEQHRDLINRAQGEVLPLALAIADKVTRRMGTLDPRVVEANAREAVRLVLHRHDLRIIVHPLHKSLMDEIAHHLQQQWTQLQHITIVADAAIVAGGCRVITAGGEIDADLQSQLDRIARELVPESDSTSAPTAAADG